MPVRAEEQVAYGLARPQGQPPLPLMLFPVVEHVAALAERLKIVIRIVGRVVIEMGGRQHNFVCLTREPVAGLKRASARPFPFRQAFHSSSHHLPSPRCCTRRSCGRPHASHRPFARSKRITSKSYFQSIG